MHPINVGVEIQAIDSSLVTSPHPHTDQGITANYERLDGRQADSSSAPSCEVYNCPSSFTSPPTCFPSPRFGVPHNRHRWGILAASFTHIFSLSEVHPILIVGLSPDLFSPLYFAQLVRSRATRPGPGASLCSTSKCLDVRGGVLANGTPVQIRFRQGTPTGRSRGIPTMYHQQPKCAKSALGKFLIISPN